MTARTIAMLAASIALTFASRTVAQRAAVPDLGLMYNSDGDTMFRADNPAANTAYLNGAIDELRGAGVDTFMWNIGYDVLHYKTDVASRWGWRTTSTDHLFPQVARGRIFNDLDYDPLRAVADRVKATGGRFILSYRMNDDHFADDPQNYALTGEFWLANQSRRIGSSAVTGRPAYANLLNYKYEAVRLHRTAIIDESIDRYAAVMDGYELDFNRVQVFFGASEATGHAYLMTQIVDHVRAKLDAVQQQTGRQQTLVVRVPATLSSNAWSGLEVDKWIRERKVDVVVPSVLQNQAYEVPVKSFVDIATDSGSGVKIAPAVYPRTNYGWNLIARPTAAKNYQTEAWNGKVASVELTRGAASNYRYAGAVSMQMYNYGNDWTPVPGVTSGFPNAFGAATAMKAAEPTLGLDRTFAITPGNEFYEDGNFEYAKQLPSTVATNVTGSYTLTIGDDIDRLIRERPDDVILRLGLRTAGENAKLDVTMNGVAVQAGAVTGRLFSVGTIPAAYSVGAPQHFLQIPIADLKATLRRGENAITVKNTGLSGSFTITDLQLGIVGVNEPGSGPLLSTREPQANLLRRVLDDANGTPVTFVLNDRVPNGLATPGGGIYVTGQASASTGNYDYATGFVFDQAMYYPQVEGELASIDYSFWLGKTSASRPTSKVSLIVVQDGVVYTLATRWGFEQPSSLTSLVASGAELTAADFLRERDLDDGFNPDTNAHPDFSTSGAPLYFGWLLSDEASAATPGYSQPYTDLDDLVITFRPASSSNTNAPEPASLFVATAALTIAVKRARPRA